MYRILVIGGGSIGERHVRCFLRTARASVFLCEPRDDVRNRLQNQYPLAATYATLDESLDQSLDGAVICAPAHLHVDMAKRLVSQGIHTLIEKPFSTSQDGCDTVIRLAREKNVVAGLAYVLRHHPALRAMRTAVQSGRFGRPIEVVAVSGQHFPFYRPAYREIYYNNHATGGGAIQDALTHSVNAVEWLVGPVTRLVSDADHCVLEGVSVEDTVHVIARHDQVLSSFSLNQHQPANENTITVICEAGMARLQFHKQQWSSCSTPDAPWNIEEKFQLERDDLFVAQASAFVDAMEGRAEPACSLEDGLQTLRVNLAIPATG